MPWVRIDDHFPEHPKIARLGPDAPLCGWLWLCGLAYCNRQLTDGRIPKSFLLRLADFGLSRDRDDLTVESAAEMLVIVGLWEEDERDYIVHHYDQYQPTRAQIEAERRAKAESGRLGGIATAAARATAPAAAKVQHPPQQNASKVPAKVQPVPGTKVQAQDQAQDQEDQEDHETSDEVSDAPASADTPNPKSAHELRDEAIAAIQATTSQRDKVGVILNLWPLIFGSRYPPPDGGMVARMGTLAGGFGPVVTAMLSAAASEITDDPRSYVLGVLNGRKRRAESGATNNAATIRRPGDTGDISDLLKAVAENPRPARYASVPHLPNGFPDPRASPDVGPAQRDAD